MQAVNPVGDRKRFFLTILREAFPYPELSMPLIIFFAISYYTGMTHILTT